MAEGEGVFDGVPPTDKEGDGVGVPVGVDVEVGVAVMVGVVVAGGEKEPATEALVVTLGSREAVEEGTAAMEAAPVAESTIVLEPSALEETVEDGKSVEDAQVEKDKEEVGVVDDDIDGELEADRDIAPVRDTVTDPDGERDMPPLLDPVPETEGLRLTKPLRDAETLTVTKPEAERRDVEETEPHDEADPTPVRVIANVADCVVVLVGLTVTRMGEALCVGLRNEV